MFFSAVLLLGCSVENDENILTESVGDDNLVSRVATRPFKSKVSGDWFIVESTECDGLLQYSITGVGNVTHMGAIDADGKICTFPPEQFYVSGKYIAANGDELYWESEEV